MFYLVRVLVGYTYSGGGIREEFKGVAVEVKELAGSSETHKKKKK